jgi:hypothetical protein
MVSRWRRKALEAHHRGDAGSLRRGDQGAVFSGPGGYKDIREVVMNSAFVQHAADFQGEGRRSDRPR